MTNRPGFMWARWSLAWLASGAAALTLATVVPLSADPLPLYEYLVALLARTLLALSFLGVAALAASYALEGDGARDAREREEVHHSIDATVGSARRISSTA